MRYYLRSPREDFVRRLGSNVDGRSGGEDVLDGNDGVEDEVVGSSSSFLECSDETLCASFSSSGSEVAHPVDSHVDFLLSVDGGVGLDVSFVLVVVGEDFVLPGEFEAVVLVEDVDESGRDGGESGGSVGDAKSGSRFLVELHRIDEVVSSGERGEEEGEIGGGGLTSEEGE